MSTTDLMDSRLAHLYQQQALADANRSWKSLLNLVRDQVAREIPARDLRRGDSAVRQQVAAIARRVLNQFRESNAGMPLESLIGVPEDVAIQRITASVVGLGPIEDLLSLSGIEDIAINGPGEMWVFRSGRWFQAEAPGYDSEELMRVVNLMIAHTGRRLSPAEPIVDAVIQGGHRLNAVCWPCVGEEVSPSVCIRVNRGGSITLQDLVGRSVYDNMITGEPAVIPNYQSVPGALIPGYVARFLHACVLAGANIVVIGGTGCGKTTVLGALGRLIPGDMRILAIEDTPELNFRGDRNRPMNCVYFLTRPASLDGAVREITQNDLLKAALRQRPDALTLGEARGDEIITLLMALITGHRNGLTSIHAESVAQLVERVMQMFQVAGMVSVPRGVVAQWIASAFHLVIELEMAQVVKDGKVGRVRRIGAISEFVGHVEAENPVRQVLFQHDPRADGGLGRLMPVSLPQRRLRALLTAIGYDPGEYMSLAGQGVGGVGRCSVA